MKVYWERYEITMERREWTPRRISAAKRAIQREKDKTPLFPELAPEQTLEQRQSRIDRQGDFFSKTMRANRANCWRKARAFIRALPEEERTRLLDKWNTEFMPGSPQNLLACARMMGIYGLHNETNPDYAIRKFKNESSLDTPAVGLADYQRT
jgi:hypothetical protein